MAAKFLILTAFVAVARAGNLGYGYAPALVGSQGTVSSYSTVQHHVPAIQSYAAAAPLLHTAPLGHASFLQAAPVAYSAPVAYAAPVAKTVIAEPSAPAHYDFGYAVNDPHTGDSKSQYETRRGDAVQGSYSLLESDGTKRTVDYSDDGYSGFNAVVHKEPTSVHAVAPIVTKVSAPVAYAAPVAHAAPWAVTKVSAPVAYAGSLAHSAPWAVAGAAPWGVAPGLVRSAPWGVAPAALRSAHWGVAPAASLGYLNSVAPGYNAPWAHGYAAQAPLVAHNVW